MDGALAAGFLCKLNDNRYGVEFLEFEVKDYDSGRSVFKVGPWGGTPQRPTKHMAPADAAPKCHQTITALGLAQRAHLGAP